MRKQLSEGTLKALKEEFGDDKVSAYLEVAKALESVVDSRYNLERDAKINAMIKVFDEHYIVSEAGRVIERKSNPHTRK